MSLQFIQLVEYHYYGFSDLILLQGTTKEIANIQALEYYKEKFDDFKEHN